MGTDYERHESVYRALGPDATGWNSAQVDGEILQLTAHLLKRAGLEQPPASILEIGCGMGNLSIPLAQSGYIITGIDISPTAIETARMRSQGGAIFRVCDITAPSGWSDLEVYDCVLDGLCMHCIIGEHRGLVLECVRKALLPGNGCFLVMTMCGEPRGLRLASRFDRQSRCICAGNVAERYLGQPEGLAKELRIAGFRQVDWNVQPGSDATGDQDMFLAIARPE